MTWDSSKNRRRCFLIDKDERGKLTWGESIELKRLQAELLKHRRRIAPLPLEVLRALKDFVAKSDSEVCRENGWSVGTVLEGDEGYGPTRIVITAIGEDKILARELIDGSLETSWTLSCRDWKAIL